MPDTETHPFRPFLPENALLLMLGTFPPAPKRWCMEFYYPNYQNDMWRIFGVSFFGDKAHFLIEKEKRFDLERIIPFLSEKGVALFDTAFRIRRTKNTASDKDLEIVEQSGLRRYAAPAEAVQSRSYGRPVGYRCLLPPLWHCRT